MNSTARRGCLACYPKPVLVLLKQKQKNIHEEIEKLHEKNQKSSTKRNRKAPRKEIEKPPQQEIKLKKSIKEIEKLP